MREAHGKGGEVGGGGDEEGEAFARGAGGRGEDGEGGGGVGLVVKKTDGQKGNYWGYRRRFGVQGEAPLWYTQVAMQLSSLAIYL